MNNGYVTVAVINEQQCIGCAKCIPACPVDAIIGAQRQMHTVLAQECTGCELCIAPCPVDCISMITIPMPTVEQRKSRAQVARRRVQARKMREEMPQEQMQDKNALTADDRTKLLAARKADIMAILMRKKLK